MTANTSDQNFAKSSGSNFHGTNNFLPEVYSKKVLNFFRKSSVAEAITNTDYAGEISSFGDTVKIIKEPTITVDQYERGGSITATALTDVETTLIVDKANAFKFIVDDIESSMSHVNFKEMAASSAAYALKDTFDRGVLATIAAGASGSFTPHGQTGARDHILGSDSATDLTDANYTTVGTGNLDVGFGTNEVDPLDVLATMARKLDEANVPEEGRWVVAPPAFYEQLAKTESKLMSVDFNGGQGSIRNGLVSSGKIRGFEMYKSNNLPTAAVADGSGTLDNAFGVVLAGHISSTATAQTIVNTEVIRDPSSFGDICRGLHVYGANVLRPEALVQAYIGLD